MESNMSYVEEMQEQRTSLIGGIFGALIGSAIGAVVWAVVGLMGYVAAIVGVLIAFLAAKGYDLLKGPQGVVKMVVLCLCLVLAVGAGTVGTAVWNVHTAYQEEVNSLSAFERQYYDIPTEKEIMELTFADSEVQGELLRNFGMGLLFGVLGAYGIIFGSKKKTAAQVNAEMDSARVIPVDEADAIAAAAVPQREENQDNQQ